MKNRKFIIISFISILFSLNSIKANDFGFNTGISFSKFTNWGLSKYKISPSVGAFYDIKLNRNLYIQPELMFENIGTNLKKSAYFINKGYVDMYSFIIPINLSYRPYISKESKILIDGGLYSSISLFGNKRYEFYDLPTIEEKALNIAKRFNYGLNLGIGIQHKKISCKLSFTRGISSILKDEKAYHQSFRLTIGYAFLKL